MLRYVAIHNFGIYYGHQCLHLHTKDDFPATIVSGLGGTGKTTIAQAIHWCLYGTQKACDIMNVAAREKLEIGKTDSVEVELSIQHKGKTLTLKRIHKVICRPEGLIEDDRRFYCNDLECAEQQYNNLVQIIMPRQLFHFNCWTAQLFGTDRYYSREELSPLLYDCLHESHELYCEKYKVAHDQYSFTEHMGKINNIAQRIYAVQSGRYGDIKLIWDKGFRISYEIESIVFEGKLPEREYTPLHAAMVVACQIFCIKNELMWGCLPVIVDGSDRDFRCAPKGYLAYIRELPDSQALILKHERDIPPSKSLFGISNVYTYILETDEDKMKARITYPKKQ